MRDVRPRAVHGKSLAAAISQAHVSTSSTDHARAGRVAGAHQPLVGRSTQLEHVVIGTVAFERAGAALRRLALEHHSALRFRD